MNHELKIWPKYFARVRSGEKTFEVRRNDRDFQAGDTVTLREFDPDQPEHKAYSGRNMEFKIGYVLHLEDRIPQPLGCGSVVFSLLPTVEA